MKPEEFQFACLYVQDAQRYIAASKVQRWEVLKWAVTVNLALATAGLATSSAPPMAKWAMFGFCVLVSAVSIYLLDHYNRRLTEMREAARDILQKLEKVFRGIGKLTGQPDYSPGDLKDYDKEEMTLFQYVIGFSIVPAFCVGAATWIK
jgi:hypothetical protein